MNTHTPPTQKRLLEGRKFAVDIVHDVAPDGRAVQREIVVHRRAVAILGLLDDGRIVMIRNYRFAVGKTLWELPAGSLELQEDPRDCARRELIEETGYEASEIRPLTNFYTSPGVSTEAMHCYVATGLRHVGQDLDEGERIEVEPLPVDDVLALIRDDKIEDGKTVAAILYWSAFCRDTTECD